jgi:hypothetical protein
LATLTSSRWRMLSRMVTWRSRRRRPRPPPKPRRAHDRVRQAGCAGGDLRRHRAGQAPGRSVTHAGQRRATRIPRGDCSGGPRVVDLATARLSSRSSTEPSSCCAAEATGCRSSGRCIAAGSARTSRSSFAIRDEAEQRRRYAHQRATRATFEAAGGGSVCVRSWRLPRDSRPWCHRWHGEVEPITLAERERSLKAIGKMRRRLLACGRR